MSELNIHEDLVAAIAAQLLLREPNRVAVQTIAARVAQHFEVDERPAPLEGVLDVATGVGKTYVMAGAMELFVAAHEVSDMVVIVPSNAILKKTINNFSPGNRRSLLDSLSFAPVLVTADNFASSATQIAMADPRQVKIYLFTVQALLRPGTTQGRKTHDFQETLGDRFYDHLQAIEKLVVFADEHHSYYGPAYSAAVRDLNPWVLLGLTATPAKTTPADQIIFRYPLAAAIADKLVKTPVIVGRRDDRTDDLTKLTDGIVLLDAKQAAVASYCRAIAAPEINPIMLVVAKTIAEANSFGELLKSQEHFQGRFDDTSVLVIHSDAPDAAHEALDAVEDPTSPVRIIISVGMLKEGWDVKNVYVIASMRSSVSEILTEQTLGRGMRLPFGEYTDVEILDTLEVVAHERYEELLKKANVLNEQFIDYRTQAVVKTNGAGEQTVVTETTSTDVVPVFATPEPSGTTTEGAPEATPEPVAESGTAPVVATVEDRTAQAEEAMARLKVDVRRVEGAPLVKIPLLKMTKVTSPFSLADITETDAFFKLGHTLATAPEDDLSRMLLSARVIERDGIRTTQLVTRSAETRVHASTMLLAEDDLREQLSDIVLNSGPVPQRKGQKAALQPLLDALLEGLGAQAQVVLSANLGRAGALLVQLITTEQRRYASAPKYEEVVEFKDFDPVRPTDREVSTDRVSTFSKQIAYTGWKKAMFAYAWFDSSTERALANAVDDADSVEWWARLHINDIPILWTNAGKNYNPDLLVIETDGTHWIVETKMNREMDSEEVKAKREAAKRWANHVTIDETVDVKWKYLLLSETDIAMARGAWTSMKALGS